MVVLVQELVPEDLAAWVSEPVVVLEATYISEAISMAARAEVSVESLSSAAALEQWVA